MSLTTALQRVLNGAFRNLSESTRETLLLSLLPKSLAALLGYITLRQVNRALNAWSLNNLASRPQ